MTQEFWLNPGDRVEHVGDPGDYGVVLSIDDNLIESYGVTTCLVLWDGCNSTDIQWTNKLAMVTPAFKSRAWVNTRMESIKSRQP